MASLKSRLEHSITRNALRSYLAEFISTFIFVFAAVGSAMSSKKLLGKGASEPSGLVGSAIATAFSLAGAVYVSAGVSGGHVNPAVTFGMAIGGHLSIPMAMFYWISQMFGSILACLVLKVTTVGQHVPMQGIIPDEMTGFGASILEGVMTFALVYTVYAAADPRRGTMAAIGPLAIGFIAGANVLASGPFTGGSMNPAYSFGAAVISGSFRNQAVYWVGPLLGATIAALLYDNVVFAQGSDSLRGIGDGVGV
ncbi:putative aquaporin TIP5-1 [Apium graveolens]|uniref:putative aquaporin TIP5-1 n=1 Tax=Apium graveolens TaxID=4045 RepID=UPI003D78C21A